MSNDYDIDDMDYAAAFQVVAKTGITANELADAFLAAARAYANGLSHSAEYGRLSAAFQVVANKRAYGNRVSARNARPRRAKRHGGRRGAR